MKLKESKPELTEGLLNRIVDNFFKSLQKGVSDNYIAAAEKAGVHPEVAKSMKKIAKDWEDLDSYLEKHHNL
jgi:hypothetical protein